jgi:hypothetical protein
MQCMSNMDESVEPNKYGYMDASIYVQILKYFASSLNVDD